ncbi:MAG: pyruvate kinase [Deltaproteobacteria bacterium]|nr:MAG: pyruvate kinase [Deltaproteobacteria bacterium]
MSARRTKIVATLGPASWEPEVLAQLIRTGVDVCRINCSHSDHAGIRRQVARVRRAAREVGKPVAILLDLQGPKIRTGPVPEPLPLATGDVLTVRMDPTFTGEGTTVGTTYPEMADDVNVGDRVLFADGALSGEVSAVRHDTSPKEVDITIVDGGKLGSHKGINLPGVAMSVPSLTEKDRGDLAAGLEVGVDYVALSFVRSAADVVELKEAMRALGRDIPVVAKIEKPQAVDAIDEILEVTEGIMVARGDLGVEVDIERVPVIQKHLIQRAAQAGALVITATQMLDSMERNPRPTRAETTDVANAILDGTDAVMLSGETSVGDYPKAAVAMMDRIATEVERSRFFQPARGDKRPRLTGVEGVVHRSVATALTDPTMEEGRPLVVYTWSGSSAILASKVRAPGQIFALTPNPPVLDRLSLVWGVTPVLVPMVRNTDEMLHSGDRALIEAGLLKAGEEVVVLAGTSPVKGATNMMKIARIGE